MDGEPDQPGPLGKIWAVLGLVAAFAVGYMAVDLILARRRKDTESPADDG